MAPRNEEPRPSLFTRVSQASKRSFRSYSSSIEADDERSSTAEGSRSDDVDTMTPSIENGSAEEGPVPSSSYIGEDTRPTSAKELAGWYMYAFASEVYVICGISSFIPILLESLTRENGVLLSDHTTPCGASSDKPTDGDDGQCVVYLLGVEINTASFAMYTFSVSVLLQALVVVSISCAADHGNYRKKLLLSFGWIGAFSVMCYIFVSTKVYLLGAVLAIISNTAFGASFVLLNSFLPLLVRHHPKLQHLGVGAADGGAAAAAAAAAAAREAEAIAYDEDAISGGTQLRRVPTHAEVTSVELSLSTQISTKGIGIGYSAGLFVQCIAILLLVLMSNSTWSQRVVLFFIGSWWALFTIPAAMWLRPRPGPPLDTHSTQRGLRAWLAYAIYAWKSLFRTIRLARRLLDITLFLGAWFLLSDAVATTSSTAILFAKTQLHMKPAALGMINVISTTAGVTGAFTWPFISKVFSLRPHQTIIACIALFEVIPLYGLLGYLPFVRNWEVIGLQQPWEMYPLAALYGFVLGGIGGYCRSLYGELIPPGSEAAFYALYAITDKGSSVFGPTIVGAIIDASGEIRPAFWFLAALVGLPALPIWFVNADRGKVEGEKLAQIIEGFKVRHAGGGAADEEADDEGAREGMLAAYEREDSGDETERAVPRR